MWPVLTYSPVMVRKRPCCLALRYSIFDAGRHPRPGGAAACAAGDKAAAIAAAANVKAIGAGVP